MSDSNLRSWVPHVQWVEIRVFGCGIGEGIVVNFGNRAFGAIDCSRASVDYARDLHLRKGLKPLFFLLTHPHADHYGGAEDLLQLPFEKICRFAGLNGTDLKRLFDRSQANRHNAKLRNNGRALRGVLDAISGAPVDSQRFVSQDTTIFEDGVGPQGIKIYAIAPTAQSIRDFENGLLRTGIAQQQRASLCNGVSVVVVIEFGGCRALLCGDAHRKAVAHLRDRPIDVIKLAHHGSSGDNLSSDLRRILGKSPETIGIVTGYSSSGLPRKATMRRLTKEVFGGERWRLMTTYESRRLGQVEKDWNQESEGSRVRALGARGVGWKAVCMLRNGRTRVGSFDDIQGTANA